jgi:hypothetical protein
VKHPVNQGATATEQGGGSLIRARGVFLMGVDPPGMFSRPDAATLLRSGRVCEVQRGA